MMTQYFYKVKSIDKVVDGDTVDLTIAVGFSILFKHRFRVENIDTPETWRPLCEAERIGGIKVHEYFKNLLLDNSQNLYILSTKLDIYGRYGCKLYFINESNVTICINYLIEQFMIENHLTKEELRLIED